MGNGLDEVLDDWSMASERVALMNHSSTLDVQVKTVNVRRMLE